MSTKFNKKKILISISILFLLFSISVISIFAFQFKKPGDLSVSSLGRPSLEAVEHLAGIINFQVEIGQLRASEFRVLAYSTARNAIVAIISDSSLSVSVSGTDVSFSGTHYLYFYDSDYGFFYNSAVNSSTSFPSSNIFFSSIPISSSTVNIDGFNSSATFGTEGYNAYSIYQYYDYIYSSCVDRDERESTIRHEAQSEGESIGFDIGRQEGYSEGYTEGYSEGYSEGESNGYNEGYPDGFDTGYDYGYQFGYQDGIVTGRSEGYIQGEAAGYGSGYDTGYNDGLNDGYETGYSDGYETGYSDGYETGFNDGFSDSDFKKPGQIIAQFWRYRDDSQYQGNVWFCTIEHNGIQNYRWCTEEEIYSHYLNCEIYDYVYETNLYFQKNPLEFHYFVPQLVREESPYSGALSVENVEYRFVNLYDQRAVIELDVDHTIIGLLNDKYDEGIKDSNALVNGVASIAKSPVEALRRALDFEIFGINVGAVAVGLVAILFAIWAYNKIRKLLPI